MDTENTTRRERVRSLAEQSRGTVLDSGADIAQREPQSSDNGTVPDSGADRAVAGEDVAERVREEMGLDNPAPFDAGADLGELVRATYGGRAAADAEAAEAEARHGRAAERDGVDGEKPTHILAEEIRARPRSRAASSASAQRRAQTSSWAWSRRRREDKREASSPRAEEGAGRPSAAVVREGCVRARVRTHSMNTGEYRRPSRPTTGRD